MEASIRRLSCPVTVQYIWDCIAANRVNKQRPDMDKIFNFLKQQFDMTMVEVQQYIRDALTDKLIDIIFRVGSRGECFLFPNEQMVRDDHDWYCFECHSGGEVYSCETCFRVYHPFCVNEVLASVEVFMCPVCKLLKSEIASKIPKKELNVLLGYTSNHLKEKAKGNMMLTREPSKLKEFTVDQEGKLHLQPKNESSQQEQFPVNEDEWRQEHLIYSHMNLTIMARKAAGGQYKRLEEYKVDAQTIVHNVVIYNGVDSTYADLARQMLRECNSDLTEIQQCKDCYRFENEKEDKFWFCQPCNPPHELVYAKEAEDPYRPAKVMEKFETTYDVRFFGGSHKRAIVEKKNIEPISANVHSLVTKRSSTWKRAIKEWKSYTNILESVEVVPIGSTLKDNDLEKDSEDDPKLNRSYVSLERTSLNISNDNFISFGKKLNMANKSDQDDTSLLATPSGHAAAGLECRSFATQTGNWTPTASSSQSFTKQTTSSRDQQHFNMRSAFGKKIKEECEATKEAALRDLEIKLDKKHSEDISILKNNEKEKRKQLKKRLKEAHKIEICELQAKYLQSLSGIEQHVHKLREDV